MSIVHQFFNDKNKIELPLSEEDFLQLNHYINVVDAFSRLTYKSIYIIDYQKQSFEYVSENPLFLCGYSSEEVKAMGYDFYTQNVKTEDLDLLLKINEAGFNFYEKIPPEERLKYTISYDFHLINEKNNLILVHHQLTPMLLTEHGKIWKAMCIVSLSHHTTAGNICISKQGSNELWKYNIISHTWEKEEKVELSKREIQILKWSARGLSINDIAQQLFITADTVKFHRRKIFSKIGVQNISEALSYAKIHKLI